MSQILNKVRDVDPNNSDAVKDVLGTFFQSLPKHTEVDCFRWLRSLEGVVNRFPKYCMSNRTAVETYLSHFLDSNNYYNVIEAAKCAHALQQVRPSQEKTATAKSCWREQTNLLCTAAHSLIGALFPHAIDIYKQSGKTLREPHAANSPLSSALSHICNVKSQSSNVNKHAVIATRLRNVFVFLQAMLVEVYPVAKPIRPQTILDVIVRALSVSSGVNQTGDHDSCNVAMMKTQALRSLDALVACLGPNLIPFSPLVFRFVMQTLKWSSDNPSDDSRKVRCAAYSSFGRWLSTLRSHGAPPAGRGRCWQDELAEHVIGDITPHRRIVQLTVSNHPSKHLSKKAKRKMANTMLQESSIASHMPGEKNKIPVSEEVNDEVAIAALECAEIFLTVCGIFLKPATQKVFQERLIRECYGLPAGGGGGGARALGLLRALEALRRAAPPGAPPPTQYCLHLYSVLVNSAHREISNFCSQALLDIRLHLHCSPPSLSFAMEVQPEKQKQAENKKVISERNRAALEALLGPEKVPTLTDEEVITITDEPSSKKRRLEDDISDKISLSSESEGSIEISDDSEKEDSFVQEVVVVIEPVRETEGDDASDKENEEKMQHDEVDGNDVTDTDQTNDNETEVVEKDANDVMQVDETDDGGIEVVEIDIEHLKEKSGASPQHDRLNIHNAATQMPLNVSNDTIDDDERPLSVEVMYDYPNTGKEKITVLEKLEDENLPSTNDTDDIQITCGQVAKSSQDADSEKKSVDSDPKLGENVLKVNGFEKSPTKIVENGVSDNNNDKEGSVTAKTTNEGVSVADMLADFVDEVNEDNTQMNTPA